MICGFIAGMEFSNIAIEPNWPLYLTAENRTLSISAKSKQVQENKKMVGIAHPMATKLCYVYGEF
jgi:hypothetical protein